MSDRCPSCGLTMTSGGCPNWDCRSKLLFTRTVGSTAVPMERELIRRWADAEARNTARLKAIEDIPDVDVFVAAYRLMMAVIESELVCVPNWTARYERMNKTLASARAAMPITPDTGKEKP